MVLATQISDWLVEDEGFGEEQQRTAQSSYRGEMTSRVRYETQCRHRRAKRNSVAAKAPRRRLRKLQRI